MQTTVENTAKHTVKLTIEVPVEEYTKDLDSAYRSVANQVKIPGFRKGKVPKPIIDTQVGRDVVHEEFLNAAVPAVLSGAPSRTKTSRPSPTPRSTCEAVRGHGAARSSLPSSRFVRAWSSPRRTTRG